MSDDFAGKGDPVKTLQLLWGKAPGPRRGPKAKLALADVVAAGVAIVDRDGLGALTTRAVAEALGISPMSLYTYVPGKDELLDLMVDHVLGEIVRPRGATWRAKLTDVAKQNWALAMRHPWILEIMTHRPVLGPNLVAKYDVELSAVDGLGLGDLEMNSALTVVLDYVSGVVRNAARERWVKQRTGKSDTEWWYEVAPHLEQAMAGRDFPLASRVGSAFGEAHGAHDPEGDFAFGLERVLDGLEQFIASRRPRQRPAPSRARRAPSRRG
jgi:AcrR family transcriptional regulator